MRAERRAAAAVVFPMPISPTQRTLTPSCAALSAAARPIAIASWHSACDIAASASMSREPLRTGCWSMMIVWPACCVLCAVELKV